jgi:phage gp16-like protein
LPLNLNVQVGSVNVKRTDEERSEHLKAKVAELKTAVKTLSTDALSHTMQIERLTSKVRHERIGLRAEIERQLQLLIISAESSFRFKSLRSAVQQIRSHFEPTVGPSQ